MEVDYHRVSRDGNGIVCDVGNHIVKAEPEILSGEQDALRAAKEIGARSLEVEE